MIKQLRTFLSLIKVKNSSKRWITFLKVIKQIRDTTQISLYLVSMTSTFLLRLGNDMIEKLT